MMEENELCFRAAMSDEYNDIHDFYWKLIDDMAERSDSVGWKKGIYPSDDYIRESIRKGELYLLTEHDELCAAVIVNSDCNEGYTAAPWCVTCRKDEVLIPHALCVRADRQGSGIGKRFAAKIIAYAKENGKKAVRLDILHGNTAAVKLYSAMGFYYVQQQTMYYEDTGWTAFDLYELKL